MAKITIVKHSDYTVITNGILRDNRLSMKDMGLLIWMLSKPPTWDYTINGIVAARGGKESKDKRDTIRTALTNIEAAGYLHRRRARRDDGTLGTTEYMIYEVPPESENPILENPMLDESIQLSKDTTNYRYNNNNTVVDLLKSFGITQAKAKILAKKYDDDQVTAAIAAVKVYADKHQTQSVPGLIVKAIAEGWTAPTPLQVLTGNTGYVPTEEIIADSDTGRWA